MTQYLALSPTTRESFACDSVEHGRLLLAAAHRAGVVLIDTPDDGWTELAAIDESGHYKRGPILHNTGVVAVKHLPEAETVHAGVAA
jgi:hypothetical protein